MINLILLGIFSTLKAKIGAGILGSILGFQFIKNWAKIVDFIAKKVKAIAGKLESLF